MKNITISNTTLRREKADELRKLSTAIRNCTRYNECMPYAEDCKRISDALVAAAGKCQKPQPNRDESWGYPLEASSLSLPEASINSTRREKWYMTLTLKIKITGNFLDNNSSEDHLETLDFQIIIEGISEEKSSQPVKYCWHHDIHVDAPDSNQPKEAHPYYHFQFGGNACPESELLPEPPRLAHPPLDGILGIDFVLSNFFGIVWQRLIQTEDYKSVIRDAQKRLWKPYVRKLLEIWEQETTTSPIKPEHLWPHLIVKRSHHKMFKKKCKR